MGEGQDGEPKRPTSQAIEQDPPNDGPHKSPFEPDGDRPDDAEHEDRVRVGIAEAQVRDKTQFGECSDRRSDRRENVGHEARSILGVPARGRSWGFARIHHRRTAGPRPIRSIPRVPEVGIEPHLRERADHRRSVFHVKHSGPDTWPMIAG